MKFTRRAGIRVLLLLPVLATVSWLAWEIARPRADGAADGTEVGGAAGMTAHEGAIGAGNGAANGRTERAGSGYAGVDTASGDGTGAMRGTEGGGAGYADANAAGNGAGADSTPQLFEFDPNTVSYHDLVRLGFTRGEALGIVKYRERGKVFEIAEDFAACYQVSEAAYLRLAPYIRIGERFRLKPFAPRGGAARDGAGADGTTRAGGSNSTAAREGTATAAGQSSEWSMDGTSGAGTAQVAGRVAEGTHGAETPTPPRMMSPAAQRPAPVDLNTADSAALIAVRGIGPRTVAAIMEYRRRLGGFARVEQLAEVRGVTEQNYTLMLEQIYVDPAVIQKIDINFAPAKLLAEHPYLRAEALRKLLKQRQLKGGWRTTEELEQDNIFTADELSRLGPYLDFK